MCIICENVNPRKGIYKLQVIIHLTKIDCHSCPNLEYIPDELSNLERLTCVGDVKI